MTVKGSCASGLTRLLVASISVLALAGCGWLGDRGLFINPADDYLDATEPPPLEVPEDLDSVRVQDTFPVPAIPEQPRPELFPGRAPKPGAIFASDSRDDVRIQRLGDRSWLIVPEPPSVVWPQIRQFLADNGVAIADELPFRGFIDTEWLSVSAEGEYRDLIRERLRQSKTAGVDSGVDRLRLKLEQGLRARTSELHLRHDVEPAPVTDERIGFDPATLRSDTVEIEQSILAELGGYMAASVSQQTVSMVAQDISTQAKATLARDDLGNPVLRLNLDFERAWATVASALINAGVEISDQDQQARRYDTSIEKSIMTGQSSSWYCGFLPCDSKGSQDVRIALNPADNAYLVSVRDLEDAYVDPEFANEVLILLRDNSG